MYLKAFIKTLTFISFCWAGLASNNHKKQIKRPSGPRFVQALEKMEGHFRWSPQSWFEEQHFRLENGAFSNYLRTGKKDAVPSRSAAMSCYGPLYIAAIRSGVTTPAIAKDLFNRARLSMLEMTLKKGKLTDEEYAKLIHNGIFDLFSCKEVNSFNPKYDQLEPGDIIFHAINQWPKHIMAATGEGTKESQKILHINCPKGLKKEDVGIYYESIIREKKGYFWVARNAAKKAEDRIDGWEFVKLPIPIAHQKEHFFFAFDAVFSDAIDLKNPEKNRIRIVESEQAERQRALAELGVTQYIDRQMTQLYTETEQALIALFDRIFSTDET